ncbi:hypothetical protein S83_033135, partial [Arachis hypogaea]
VSNVLLQFLAELVSLVLEHPFLKLLPTVLLFSFIKIYAPTISDLQRFIPAEFGADPTKVQIYDLEDGHNLYAPKLKICQMVEAEHIPYTCICYNFFMKILLPSLVQPGLNALPSDKVTIFGDGNKKGVFVKENDVAAFTISTVDKPRTLNKLLYLRPSKNICSLNELVEMWETKIGKKLEKSHISEEELIKKIEGNTLTSN